jgi:Acetyltransferase (isoleucine patch superfamily)
MQAQLKDRWGVEGAIGPRLGSAGFTLPDLQALKWFPLEDVSNVNLEVCAGQGAANNWLVCPEDWQPKGHLLIFLHGAVSDNVVIVGHSNIYGSMHLHANNGLVIIGDEIRQFTRLDIRQWSSDSLFFWGKGSTANGATIAMQGAGGHVIVGEDCMFAKNTVIRNSDEHGIMCMQEAGWLNPPGNVLLEPHVWVAQEVLILKNTEIGCGSVIGAKSLVSKSIPRFAMAAGVPAKVVREGISWDRNSQPTAEGFEKVKALAASLQ